MPILRVGPLSLQTPPGTETYVSASRESRSRVQGPSLVHQSAEIARSTQVSVALPRRTGLPHADLDRDTSSSRPAARSRRAPGSLLASTTQHFPLDAIENGSPVGALELTGARS